MKFRTALRVLSRALTLAACALLAGDAWAQVQVTALEGEASVAGVPLALHAGVAEGRPLAVEEEGRCTLLLGSRTLVRLCGRAVASVGAAGTNRPGSIELREGGLEVVALPDSQKDVFRIHTPATSLVLLGSSVYVEVAPGGAETTVSALDSAVRLIGQEEGARVLPGQQRTVSRDGSVGAPRPVSRASLASSSSCFHQAGDFQATLRADRALLAAAGLPMVSAEAVDATPAAPIDDLLDIVRMDVPVDGLPLQAPAAPSALVTELSKRGVDEEVCDPINCNPVYQVDPPGTCGIPPERGCIP